MMSVGLHCRFAGRPGRARAWPDFSTTSANSIGCGSHARLDIARHWHREHPALAADAPLID